MAIIATSLPFVYQSDRLVLAHGSASPAQEIARYSIVSLIYSPLFSVVGFGGQALWPLFMRHHAHLTYQRRLYLQALGSFSLLGLVLGGSLVVLGPYVAHFISSDADTIPRSLYVSFGVLLAILTASYPTGMLLMDHKGRWFQAVGCLLMVAIKLPLAVVWVHEWGGVGMVWSSIIADLCALVIPSVLYAELRMRSAAARGELVSR
jgi:hypothetical protein